MELSDTNGVRYPGGVGCGGRRVHDCFQEASMNTDFKPFSRLRGSSLCRRDIPITSARETIGWWETRRIPFNLIVGIAGTISTVVVCVVGLGSYFLFDGDFGFPPPLFAVFGVLLYPLQRMCSSLGDG
jgi:hypothetical protein